MDMPRQRDAENSVETITDQIEEGIAKGKYSLQEMQEALMSKTKEAAQSTDKLVRENPWYSIGIAAGVGFIIGIVATRR